MAVARQTRHPFHGTGKIGRLAVTGHRHRAESSCRFHGQQDMPDAMPFVCRVPSARCARLHGHAATRVVQQLC